VTTPTISPASSASSDQIEEQVRLHAPRARVWRALTNADELGAWFGANLVGETLAPGTHVRRHMSMPGYEHVPFDVIIEEVVPEERFAWRWHPHALDPSVDHSAEPRTLVTFLLEDAPDGGTLLRVIEAGFDGVAAGRRAAAFLGNTNGWHGQLHKRLPAYLASA